MKVILFHNAVLSKPFVIRCSHNTQDKHDNNLKYTFDIFPLITSLLDQ